MTIRVLGRAVADFLHPDRVVVGIRSAQDREVLAGAYVSPGAGLPAHLRYLDVSMPVKEP
ncbi:MAG TPA: hypothetical protein VNZ06_11070 [Steroidobacteraceae bacterium]|jgi:UDP-glucose 6-dehydrogenase|nr:hypothetical protein [Steroidobacteraceae bacterium]